MRTTTKLKIMFSVLAGLLLGMCAVTNAKAIEPGEYILAADACYEPGYIEDLGEAWDRGGTEAAAEVFWTYVDEGKCIDLTASNDPKDTVLAAVKPAYEITMDDIGTHVIWEALTRTGETVYVLLPQEA